MLVPRILSISFDNLSGLARNVLLAHAGYAVSPATSTTRAFELLGMLEFDLVIIGDTVPTAERRLLFLEIRRKIEVPILLMDSGEADPLIRARAHIDSGATPEQLLAAVHALVPMKRNRRAGQDRRADNRLPPS
jgi:DNA-binding response OmpR family regulator